MTTDTLDLELEPELPRRERRRLVTPAAIAAGAVIIAALGFLGGVQVQKSQGATDTPGGGGAFTGGVRPPGGGVQASDATVGEVASIDGSTIYIDGADGTTVKVRLAKGGKVTRTAASQMSAIHPGDTVIVQGETADSGTVVASTIRATASNAAGGFGG